MEFFESVDHDINEQLSLRDNFLACMEARHIFADDRDNPDVYYTYRSMFITCILEELAEAWQHSTLQGLQLLCQILIIYDEAMLPRSVPTALLALTPIFVQTLVSLP